MRVILAVASWFALTAALWIMAYVWPPVSHVLIPTGAVSMAFVALFIGEGVVQEVRGTTRMRRYERQRAAFLAHRARFERKREDGE